MKKIVQIFLISLFFQQLCFSQIISTGNYCDYRIFGVGAVCDSMPQVCPGFSFNLSTNVASPAANNNYDCLGSQPNPFWGYFQIGQSGSVSILLSNSNQLDIDFILWGPFQNAQAAQAACGNMGQAPNATNGYVVDCSYSGSANEQIDIASALAGEIYVVLITNFSNQPTVAQIAQVGGTGSLNCGNINNASIEGIAYNDQNSNCQQDSGETVLANHLLWVSPSNYYIMTDSFGHYSICAFPDTYNIQLVTDTFYWQSNCLNNNSLTVVISSLNDSIVGQNFPMQINNNCSALNVDLAHNVFRPCFNNPMVVNYSNQSYATASADSAYIFVTLDSAFTFLGATIPNVPLGNNQYQFYVGNLAPGASGQFSINTFLSCSTPLMATICNEASIIGADTCLAQLPVDTSAGNIGGCLGPWDRSSLRVEGSCINDSIIRFVIYNTGSPANGNMQCFRPIRVYVDTSLYLLDSLMLAGGDSLVFEFPANGFTWTLETDQHPLHPGNSHPNAHVELCGNAAAIAQNWTPNVVSQFVQNQDPITDVDCGITVASMDPNDKRGFPLGIGAEHFIERNKTIDYIIRFQNTGTDTAFNVVIRDTLAEELDITSIISAASSHNYWFTVAGPRVLEWHFDNIMLPDSNVNELESHGFVSFSVAQMPNLPDGTLIENFADIYFDFNAPVRTNTAWHLIGRPTSVWVPSAQEYTNSTHEWELGLFPNPTSGNLTISSAEPLKHIHVYAIQGQQLKSYTPSGNLQRVEISLSDLPAAIYYLQIESYNGNKMMKKVVKGF